MAAVDEDAGYVRLFIAIALVFIISGFIFHWFDGLISFIWLSIQVLAVFLIIGGVIYLIYYFINQSKYGETLRQFTRPWIGILLIISLIIYAEYFFLRYGFQKGFTTGIFSYHLFLAIVIGFVIISPLIREKSIISTLHAVYISIFFVVMTAIGTILNQIFTGDWGGSVFFISLIFSTIFIGLYYALPELIKQNATYDDELPSQRHFTGNKITIYDIDKMEGTEFERFLKRLFENIGYSADLTNHTTDWGADLILYIAT
jgi:hypothetical protein